jgi:hypothetical protein
MRAVSEDPRWTRAVEEGTAGPLFCLGERARTANLCRRGATENFDK